MDKQSLPWIGFICNYLILCLISPLILSAYTIFDKPNSLRNANYLIDVRLDAEKRLIVGKERIIWKNASPIPVKELQLHLYMNAFRNPQSTFLKNRRLDHRMMGSVAKDKLGGIDLYDIVLNDYYNLTSDIEYIQPDDGNENDSTVIRIPLSGPVSPGEEITLDIDFHTRLPELIARSGYRHNFFLLGQWYPKIGVFQDGEWICHQFHANSEFFADFGVYEVSLMLPREYEVGATGILIDSTVNGSTKKLVFRAEDVHDFAIAAWPDFKKQVKNIQNIKVTLLYAPEHSGQVGRYFKTIEGAIEYFDNWLMPYPYPNLTLVDVPLFAFLSAGMEYPCFITCGSIWGFPHHIKLFPEDVTIHEFAHQYFYGILASNEAEEPWLDEGFTSYATQKILSHLFGHHESMSTLFTIKKGSYDEYKKTYMARPNDDIILKASWEFDRRNYGRYVYDKSVLMLQTLENYLGAEKMNLILKTYLDRWKFKHPGSQDFLDIVNEIAPQNMDWFFQQALYKTDVLDYSLEQIRFRKMENTGQEKKKSDIPLYESVVKVKRNGTFIFPVEVEIMFSNGDTISEQWDGADPFKVFSYHRPEYVISARVDPERKIWLDINWTNNSKTIRESDFYYWRHWFKSLNIYQNFLSGFFTF